MKICIFIFALSIILILNSCTKNNAEIVFVDVNVVPMNTEKILTHQTVIIKGKYIAEIGHTTTTKISENAIKIDARDKYLMPGLADMHAHAWTENQLYLFLANGVTTIRNMGGAPIHLEFKSKIENGELHGPTIYTAGPVVDGFPPIWPGSVEVEGPIQAKKVITEHKKAGYDFIKIYNNLSKQAFESIILESNNQKIPVAGHVPFNVSLENVLKSGINSIEHFEGYGLALQSDDAPFKDNFRFSMTQAWEYLDDTRLNNIVSLTKESSVWNCPTMVVFKNMFIDTNRIDEIINRPEMDYIEPYILDNWIKQKSNNEINFNRDLILENRNKVLRALHKKNVPILLGTDCGNHFTVQGFSIHDELQNLVEADFTPYEAIKAGTVEASKFLNTPGVFGTVNENCRANLILVEKNPLENVRNASLISGVMVQGLWLSREQIKQKLQEIENSYKLNNL